MKKSILITGSTDGIGKLAALKLAKAGHHVYIHGRIRQKVDNTILEISDLSNNKDIEGFVADFSNLIEVDKMADEILERVSQLDVLINNAGVFKSSQSHKNNGFDLRFAVNYLSPYHLTERLLPSIQNSDNPRIINLSSAAQSAVSLEALSGDLPISVQEAYAQSKLALTMWSFDLAHRLKNIVVIAVNPGSLLNTRMVQEAYGTSWSSADKGRDILYDLATEKEYNSASGKYFDNDKGDPKGSFGKAHADAYNWDKIDELRMTTKALIGEALKQA